MMKNTRLKAAFRSWWFTLGAAVFLALSVRSAVADWNDVPTGSMKPTIPEGDRIYVNRLAYDLKVPFTTVHVAKWGDPQRGDIVVFRSPQDGKKLVKRIIGIPGDVVSMKDNRLTINGDAINYVRADGVPGEGEPGVRYLDEGLPGHSHRVQLVPWPSLLTAFGPVTVPGESYLMLGDNRNNSADSRVFGFVPRRSILGKATAVALSLDINNGFVPRWERFFSRLD